MACGGLLKAEDGTTSNGTWVAWELNRDVTGRIMGETTPEGDVLAGTSTAGDRGAAYDRAFTYDRAGRLTEVKDVTAQPGETVNTDPAAGAVTPTTVRKYVFDKNGNRASLTTRVNGTQTAKRTWAYDAADRVGVGAGYVHDGLGRQTTIPAANAPAAAGGVKAGVGAITVKYFADDAAAAITRNGTTSTIARDPSGRRLSVTSTGTAAAGTETKHYADDSDNPGWTTRTQGTETVTTRYESTIGGDLALTITRSTVELAVNNPHGDVVATVPLTGTGAGQGITGWAQYDEYGNQLTEPVSTGATSYGWHGADERAVDTSGLILMGARLHNSVTGLFTSRDPVEGGNTTSYAYPQDPVGMNDITGMWGWLKRVARRAAPILGRISTISGYAPSWLCSFCGAVSAISGGLSAASYFYTGQKAAGWGQVRSTAVGLAFGRGVSMGVKKAYKFRKRFTVRRWKSNFKRVNRSVRPVNYLFHTKTTVVSHYAGKPYYSKQRKAPRSRTYRNQIR